MVSQNEMVFGSWVDKYLAKSYKDIKTKQEMKYKALSTFLDIYLKQIINKDNIHMDLYKTCKCERLTNSIILLLPEAMIFDCIVEPMMIGMGKPDMDSMYDYILRLTTHISINLNDFLEEGEFDQISDRFRFKMLKAGLLSGNSKFDSKCFKLNRKKSMITCSICLEIDMDEFDHCDNLYLYRVGN